WEGVADPGFGGDVLRLGRVAFELAAERGDQHAEVLGLIDGIGAPDRLEDRAMREPPAGVLRQEQQELELLRGQPQLVAAPRDAAVIEIDREISAAYCDVTREAL